MRRFLRVLLQLTGPKILACGLCIGIAGPLPLLAYIKIVGDDGNPLGLGLLMVAAEGCAALLIVSGIVVTIVELVKRRPQS